MIGSLGITVELAEKPVSCSANLLKTLSRVLSYISVCTATPKDPDDLLFLPHKTTRDCGVQSVTAT
jgi:hypothetical protein